jgi:hypothetical protein
MWPRRTSAVKRLLAYMSETPGSNWFPPPNSTIVTKYQTETEAALYGLKEQQTIANSKLDAIRDELRALNDKAAGAGSVAPPSRATP